MKCKSAYDYTSGNNGSGSIFVDMNAIIESGKVVSKDSYPYFSENINPSLSDLQLFAATPEIGAEGLISMLDKDFSGISKIK